MGDRPIKVLMLGWEYPPHISGGLGMACEGLSKGLDRQGVDITFVVPRLHGEEHAPHMTLLEPTAVPRASWQMVLAGAPLPSELLVGAMPGGAAEWDPASLERVGIPAFLKPYWTETEFEEHARLEEEELAREKLELEEVLGSGQVLSRMDEDESVWDIPEPSRGPGMHYGHDIFQEVSFFTQRVVRRMRNADFDLIHAHDWMTYPAGVALRELTGKPLLVHVHSLEYDRSGENVNPRIDEIERMGLHCADAIAPVSHYTKSIIHEKYGIPLERIHAVHNGIYPKKVVRHYRREREWPEHVVLFLGRVTFQKGPEYFIRAAAKVVPHIPDVLFVLAGSGDMLMRMKAMVKALGLTKHFRFPGFLVEKEVEEVLSVTSLYVMPSVSEPFGLSALEAINFDVPTLISKQSGVSEVVSHALKFDFWDVDRLADLIINGLLHEEMRKDMSEMAGRELKNVHWDASAKKTLDIYEQLLS